MPVPFFLQVFPILVGVAPSFDVFMAAPGLDGVLIVKGKMFPSVGVLGRGIGVMLLFMRVWCFAITAAVARGAYTPRIPRFTGPFHISQQASCYHGGCVEVGYRRELPVTAISRRSHHISSAV